MKYFSEEKIFHPSSLCSTMEEKMMRISYDELHAVFQTILHSRGFSDEDAKDAATVFANNSLDGVYSHGVNRFPRTVEYLDRGEIDPHAKAVCEGAMGAFERWNGHRGFGPINARKAMARACELAKVNGIGIVALGNNNHWMRGGSYGWQAADAGCIGICWSNTMPNMPAWGGKDRKIGNNPLVIAVPRSNGKHVVVDCAMSQFSYGKIEETKLKGGQLPVPGGYDTEGKLSTDPIEIEKTWRVLPMGYWKGSSISILLDLIATILTNQNSVSKIGTFDHEVGLSQVMIAINPQVYNTPELTDQIIQDILQDIKSSEPDHEGGEVRYPGERDIRTREENLRDGIPVVDEVWEKIRSYVPEE